MDGRIFNDYIATTSFFAHLLLIFIDLSFQNDPKKPEITYKKVLFPRKWQHFDFSYLAPSGVEVLSAKNENHFPHFRHVE